MKVSEILVPTESNKALRLILLECERINNTLPDVDDLSNCDKETINQLKELSRAGALLVKVGDIIHGAPVLEIDKSGHMWTKRGSYDEKSFYHLITDTAYNTNFRN